MVKTIVIDTNVLLHDYNSILSFQGNNIIIPFSVIEELDRFKNRSDGVGMNARKSSKIIDELRKSGSLAEGVNLKTGGIFKVELNHINNILNLDFAKIDNRIISVAYNLKNESDNPVILVTKDLNMRIMADALGIQTEDYITDKVKSDSYKGFTEIIMSSDRINEFYETGSITDNSFNLYPNQYAILKDGISQSALARHKNGSFYKFKSEEFFGIKALNKEQKFAIDLLLDDNVKVISINGKAGTGKTLITLAAALHKVLETKMYTRVLVARPTVSMGKEIGFTPGDIDEKLRPWMQPIFDNLEFLFQGCGYNVENEIENLIDMGRIKFESLSHIRGRSIPRQFLIVDESQNLIPLEIKTILTRVGKGTKVVCIGDISQIDNPYLDEYSNGLSYIIDRLKGVNFFGHISLQKSERSDVAEVVSNLL